MQEAGLTYRFRPYPKKEQEGKLLEALELYRYAYNYFLAQLRRDKIPSRLKLQAQLPKQDLENRI